MGGCWWLLAALCRTPASQSVQEMTQRDKRGQKGTKEDRKGQHFFTFFFLNDQRGFGNTRARRPCHYTFHISRAGSLGRWECWILKSKKNKGDRVFPDHFLRRLQLLLMLQYFWLHRGIGRIALSGRDAG